MTNEPSRYSLDGAIDWAGILYPGRGKMPVEVLIAETTYGDAGTWRTEVVHLPRELRGNQSWLDFKASVENVVGRAIEKGYMDAGQVAMIGVYSVPSAENWEMYGYAFDEKTGEWVGEED